MIRKEPADYVFFNVKFNHLSDEAIAIYQGVIVNIGSIPYIFSNYRGFKDYNAQGNRIDNELHELAVGNPADGLFIYTEEKKDIIWQIIDKQCLAKDTSLLDPQWDDH